MFYQHKIILMASNKKREKRRREQNVALLTGEAVGGGSFLSGGEWNLTKASPYAMFYQTQRQIRLIIDFTSSSRYTGIQQLGSLPCCTAGYTLFSLCPTSPVLCSSATGWAQRNAHGSCWCHCGSPSVT